MEYVYGALLLHKLGKTVDAGALMNVVKAAGVEADESKVRVLVASLDGVDIDKELENASLAVAAGASAEVKVEEKKEEPKEKKEAAAEGLSTLFG